MTSDRPNIVLVLTDQQQGAMLGCAGHPFAQTPSMDRLAAEGARFTNAFCTTPQCSASRASIMTGLYPHRHGVKGNIPETSFGPSRLPTDLPSLGTALHEAGYASAYFGKWHLGGKMDPASNPSSYGFDHFVPTRFRVESDSESDLAEEAARFLENYDQPAPLFLIASFNDPHGVYQLANVNMPLDTGNVVLPTSFGDDLSGKPQPQRVFRDEDQPVRLPRDPETARRYLAWYAYMTARADGYLGLLLEAIDGRPDLANNTVVIFASDHGDLGFAHGLPYKGPCMYEELVRVPLIMRGPGISRRAVRDELVTLADIFPTICELTGLTPPPGIDGTSLLPLLRGERPAWRGMVISEYHGKQRWSCPIRMVRTKQHKLTLYATGERELYELDSDPEEMTNLAGTPGCSATEQTLLSWLSDWLVASDDPFMSMSPTDRQGNPLPSISRDSTREQVGEGARR